MPDPTASPLHYAPPPPKLRRRLRRIAFWAAIGLLLLLAGLLMPSVLRQARLLRLQRACEQYSAPATQVAFEVGPPPAAKAPSPQSGSAGGGSEILQARAIPQWDAFAQAAPAQFQPRTGILFMHKRLSPSGQARLVVVNVSLIEPGVISNIRPFAVRVIRPGTALRPPQLIRDDLIRNPLPASSNLRRLRYYAGQADPTDASHFTLSYTIGTHPGLIDGWLQDDESVLLEARKP